MVQTGKLIVISVLAIIGLSAIGGGFYLSNVYIEDQLNTGIEDLLVIKENFENNDPSGYKDWLTNKDSGDDPTFKKYYFWNLTNSDEYLTGAKPVFEEIGPYVYRQYDEKINVSITATTMSYQTYTTYEFSKEQSFAGASEDDLIINVNPAYMGVIAGAGSESALVTGFVGPTIEGILDGLKTDFTSGTIATGVSKAMVEIMNSLAGDFVSNVRVQGSALAMNTTLEGLLGEFPEGVLTQAVALGLLDIQEAMTESFQTAVNATTAANVMYANWATAETIGDVNTANADFFNSTTFNTTYGSFVAGAPPIKGVSEFLGTVLGVSNSSATKLLWDGPDGIPVPGWFSDLSTGTGVLGFLQLYDNATKEVGGMTKAILGGVYGGLVDSQLDGLAAYLNNYLISNNSKIEGAYQAGNAGETTQEAAEAMFEGQWANATTLPGGADINADGNVPDGFEIGLPIDSDLSNLAVRTLFDASNPLSLTNDSQGVHAWWGAIQGNATLQTLVNTTYSPLMNSTQLSMLYTWFETFRNNTIYLGTISQFGVSTLSDLGYVHWGNSTVTSGLSLWDLSPDIGAYPEPWAWATHIDGSSYSMNMSNSLNLLSGAYNLTDTTSVGAFMLWGSQALAGNTTALPILNAAFGTKLDTTDIVKLLGFLSYVADTLVLSELPVTTYADLPAYHWGNSTVTKGESVNEIKPVGFWPEFWAYANRVLSANTTFDLSTSKVLTTALQTVNGTGAFFKYGSQAAGGNATALAVINTAMGGLSLNSTEVGQITEYLTYLLNTLVLPVMGISSTGDIAYQHFGSSIVTGGDSLKTLAPDLGLPDVPEFWAWASAFATAKNLTLDQSKALLTGSNSLLNSTTVGMMLLAAGGLTTGDATTLGMFNALLGGNFSVVEYTLLLGYIQYMMQTYVADWVLAPIFAAGGGLIANKTVGEWLWEDEDPLLLFLKQNDQVDDAHWSFFPQPDNSSDPAIADPSTFMTGADDIANIMQYVMWQGKSEIPDRDDDPEEGVWNHVEKIEGTTASQFHPGVKKTEKLKAWIAELMRTIQLVHSTNTTVQGIDLLRFVLDSKVLDINPDFDQTVKGLANMTYAQGVPLFVSKPHFLDADNSVRTVGGLAPNVGAHDTYIDVEPNSGAVMNAAKRLQVSFRVAAGNYLTKNIATHYIPVVWIEEGGTVTEDVAQAFKDNVYTARQLQSASPIAGSALGVVLIYASIFIAIRSRKP